MAVRGIYTQEEETIIAEFNQRVEKLVGWLRDEPTLDFPYPVFHREANSELVKQMAKSDDPWNPLWQDENYAKNTRWGGIIAPPLFPRLISHGGSGWVSLNIPANLGQESAFIGTDWEFFRPVRINDEFRVWHAKPQIIDITDADGFNNRKFRVLANYLKYYNQKDELVAIFKRYFDQTILPETRVKSEPKVGDISDYRYSREELQYIDRIAAEEEIRGSAIRFWEEVDINDELKPVVIGPITEWDMMIGMMSVAFDYRPMRIFREKKLGGIVDPDTGVVQSQVSHHISDRLAKKFGEPKSVLVSSMAESFLARLVSNWIGDDGFIRKYSWRMLGRAHRGDTFIGQGKVITKRIENGEHLVDLSLWSESMTEGGIFHAADATVRLLSRENI
jgi:hypothetical protein